VGRRTIPGDECLRASLHRRRFGPALEPKFFLIPCLVLPFLFQHAIQGWCPPIPILRRRGIRTRREIDLEKYAIKALRGDFTGVRPDGIDPNSTGRQAWDAADS
jgi:hypothetical protein